MAEALRRKADVAHCSDAALLDVLEAGTPCSGLYTKACKGRKDNPNCLCNLIPAPGSFRRKGLWQKDSSALLSLEGPDPADTQRKVLLVSVTLLPILSLAPRTSFEACRYKEAGWRHAGRPEQPRQYVLCQ